MTLMLSTCYTWYVLARKWQRKIFELRMVFGRVVCALSSAECDIAIAISPSCCRVHIRSVVEKIYFIFEFVV
jgi:hypothetical protein